MYEYPPRWQEYHGAMEEHLLNLTGAGIDPSEIWRAALAREMLERSLPPTGGIVGGRKEKEMTNENPARPSYHTESIESMAVKAWHTQQAYESDRKASAEKQAGTACLERLVNWFGHRALSWATIEADVVLIDGLRLRDSPTYHAVQLEGLCSRCQMKAWSPLIYDAAGLGRMIVGWEPDSYHDCPLRPAQSPSDKLIRILNEWRNEWTGK